MSEKRLFMQSIKSRCERYAVRSDVCHANTMDQLKVRVIELFRAIAVAVSIGIHLKCTF